MTNLNNIISTLSSEEQQQFINYLEYKNKRKDTKNIILFRLLAKNEFDSKTICSILYKTPSKDAYHALRKRLYQSIIDFIANSNLKEENSIDMQIIKYILASRTFLNLKHYKVAYNILDKAETIAAEHHLFAILNEIYHTKIQYAYANPQLDLNALIVKFKNNQKNHYLEDQLNIVYAKIKQTLNNITYKGQVIDFETLINNTLKEYNINSNDLMSFKSLYQLITIVSISAFVSKNYLKIEPFLIHTYKAIQKHKNKDKQLFYHIQVLYLIANTLFRNKKFNNSLLYLEQMHNLMQLKRKKYYKTFQLKYNLLLALNLNYSNRQTKAIETLLPFTTYKHQDTESLLDIHLSLIMFYIQSNDYKKAHQLFSKFYHTDNYYETKAGKEWILKKNLIEIILHIELQNINLVDSRLLSFKRLHYKYLKKINQDRVITYLSLIEYYYKNPEQVTTEAFHTKVEHAFEWIEAKQEDIFVMSYYAWLKSKMENKSLYMTTLQLIKQAQTVN